MHHLISLIATHTCLTGEVNSIYGDFAAHPRLRLRLTVHFCNLNNFSATLLGLSKLYKQKGMPMHSTGHRLVKNNLVEGRSCSTEPSLESGTVFCMWDWNPNLTKSCLFLWSMTDVTLQGDLLHTGRCSVWNDEGAVGIPSKFEHSTLDVQRWESTFNQGLMVHGFAVTLKANVTHYNQSHMQNAVRVGSACPWHHSF